MLPATHAVLENVGLGATLGYLQAEPTDLRVPNKDIVIGRTCRIDQALRDLCLHLAHRDCYKRKKTIT